MAVAAAAMDACRCPPGTTEQPLQQASCCKDIVAVTTSSSSFSNKDGSSSSSRCNTTAAAAVWQPGLCQAGVLLARHVERQLRFCCWSTRASGCRCCCKDQQILLAFTLGSVNRECVVQHLLHPAERLSCRCCRARNRQPRCWCSRVCLQRAVDAEHSTPWRRPRAQPRARGVIRQRC